MAALLALLVALMIAFPQRIVKADTRMVYEQESRYNYIQVLQVEETRYLMLNEGQGVHSVYSPNTLDTFGTWDMFIAAPFFNPPATGPGTPHVYHRPRCRHRSPPSHRGFRTDPHRWSRDRPGHSRTSAARYST